MGHNWSINRKASQLITNHYCSKWDITSFQWLMLHYIHVIATIYFVWYICSKQHQKAPQGGWRSSPPACTALLIFGSSFQKPCDLDLGLGPGHISMHNTYSTTSVPNHLTVASRSTKIWPFEFHEILTFREVWTLVIAFVEGSSNTGLQQAVDQVPYYHYQPSVLNCTRKWLRK